MQDRVACGRDTQQMGEQDERAEVKQIELHRLAQVGRAGSRMKYAAGRRMTPILPKPCVQRSG